MQTIFQNIILHSAKCYIFMKNLDLFYEKLFTGIPKFPGDSTTFVCARKMHIKKTVPKQSTAAMLTKKA